MQSCLNFIKHWTSVAVCQLSNLENASIRAWSGAIIHLFAAVYIANETTVFLHAQTCLPCPKINAIRLATELAIVSKMCAIVVRGCMRNDSEVKQFKSHRYLFLNVPWKKKGTDFTRPFGTYEILISLFFVDRKHKFFLKNFLFCQ